MQGLVRLLARGFGGLHGGGGFGHTGGVLLLLSLGEGQFGFGNVLRNSGILHRLFGIGDLLVGGLDFVGGLLALRLALITLDAHFGRFLQCRRGVGRHFVRIDCRSALDRLGRGRSHLRRLRRGCLQLRLGIFQFGLGGRQRLLRRRLRRFGVSQRFLFGRDFLFLRRDGLGRFLHTFLRSLHCLLGGIHGLFAIRHVARLDLQFAVAFIREFTRVTIAPQLRHLLAIGTPQLRDASAHGHETLPIATHREGRDCFPVVNLPNLFPIGAQ